QSVRRGPAPKCQAPALRLLRLRWCRRDFLFLYCWSWSAHRLRCFSSYQHRKRWAAAAEKSEPTFHCRTGQTAPTAEPVRIPPTVDGSTRIRKESGALQPPCPSRVELARRTLPLAAQTRKLPVAALLPRDSRSASAR